MTLFDNEPDQLLSQPQHSSKSLPPARGSAKQRLSFA